MMSLAQEPITRLPRARRAQNSLAALVLIGLLFGGPIGCRSARDNQIDLMERELRSQEDYIYELEDYVVEYSEKLRQIRCATTQPVIIRSSDDQPELANDNDGSSTRSSSDNGKPIVSDDEDSLPDPEEPDADEFPSDTELLDPDMLEVPELELEIDDPVGNLPPQQPVRQASAEFEDAEFVEDVPDMPDPAEMASDHESQLDRPQFIDDPELETAAFDNESDKLALRTVERLVITTVLRDSETDHPTTSLLAVVEARDGRDEPVDLDGAVSLMIMTADEDSPQKIKKWDFSVEETASAWQSSHLGDGLHLELPLEKTQLPDEPLELWVRLVTSDGKKKLHQLLFDPPQLLSLNEASELQPRDNSQLAVLDIPPPQPINTASVQTDEGQTAWRSSNDPLHNVASSTHSANNNPANKWRRRPADQVQYQARPSQPTNQPSWTTGRDSRQPKSSGWSITR
jgi:hypothetical protein